MNSPQRLVWNHEDLRHHIQSFLGDNGDLAVKKGFLWVLIHRPGIKCSENIMDYAAANGYLHIVRWLHEKRDVVCSVWAMNWAAENGHLHVVKWLHENRREGCTVYALIWAAANGHLHVMKFLYGIMKFNDQSLARAKTLAIRNGHISIAEWLTESK